jgi:glycosyltransferase involved in cell wall biosynthesis
VRIAFVLAGLHRVNRGAETAFESLARAMARDARDNITLIGTGTVRGGEPYHFIGTHAVPRERFERWPRVPPLRTEFVYEELTWMPSLLLHYCPSDYDASITCSYPFTNWVLRGRRHRRGWPAHVFVTENGDWPARRSGAEYRLFGCDGLVCTNPTYFARQQRQQSPWRTALIPNGVDTWRFVPGPSERSRFALPDDVPIVLMVSALNPNKRVPEGIRAVAAIDDAWLVVAGDGSMRDEVDRLAAEVMPTRFRRLSVLAEEMPHLYRSADVCLHLARDESFGNVYIEALASGLPVVAHDSPVARWIIGDNGLLVDSDIPGATAAALADVLCGDWTPPQDAVGQTARRFDWAVIAAEYRRFLDEVIAHKDGSLA